MKTRTTYARTGVPEAFDEIASSYDLMVGLSPGYHQQLTQSARVLVESLPRDRGVVRVVDLGCGSGASTAALEQALEVAGLDYELVGVDGSAGMLEQARRKDWSAAVEFVQDDAERLDPDSWGVQGAPISGRQYDGVFAAYLVRNVASRDDLLAAVRELLVPGGTLVVHDYSVAGSRVGRAKWDAVCWGIVVPLGLVTAPGSSIYRYLWRSVVDFDEVPRFRQRLVTAGFEQVGSRTFRGWQQRVLHTFVGRRPKDA